VAPRKTPDQPELGKQAAKSRRTQDAILNAVIDLINEGGFAAASSTQIARKAGVSWGAVQHHFGNKEEILEAVLEQLQPRRRPMPTPSGPLGSLPTAPLVLR
jgi:AcrR family transcriptional regulator